ncbi:MAG: hypothetical protein M2R45_03409 [Verrucomicrobia subdivision 3 bacterium]|nr:hypothetical protein [Limisphaerales bacterium]MCS1416314.1 hypothetical protein [Limisphaerales bacterium]
MAIHPKGIEARLELRKGRKFCGDAVYTVSLTGDLGNEIVFMAIVEIESASVRRVLFHIDNRFNRDERNLPSRLRSRVRPH